MLILDTNVYLDAFSDATLAGRIADAVIASGESVGLSSVVIAASCARVSATLLTRNVDDFRRIQRVIPLAMRARPT